MYNPYVKVELYEIDLWTKLRKTIRINWYSNKTIDCKLKVKKTIYYKETNHFKTNNKMTVNPFKKKEENWFNRNLYEIRRNLEYVRCVK